MLFKDGYLLATDSHELGMATGTAKVEVHVISRCNLNKALEVIIGGRASEELVVSDNSGQGVGNSLASSFLTVGRVGEHGHGQVARAEGEEYVTHGGIGGRK